MRLKGWLGSSSAIYFSSFGIRPDCLPSDSLKRLSTRKLMMIDCTSSMFVLCQCVLLPSWKQRKIFQVQRKNEETPKIAAKTAARAAFDFKPIPEWRSVQPIPNAQHMIRKL